MSLCLKDVSASEDMVLRAPAQYLGHVIDISVVTQPQVPMFPKVKSTTEIPQVPFMMVHRWLPLGTGGRFPSGATTPSTNDPDDTATVEAPQIQQPGI